MNQPQSPKRKKNAKKLMFGITPYAKMGSAKKIAKIKHFLPILDAVAKILLNINSKHPTQKLGFRETLGFAQYAQLERGRSISPTGKGPIHIPKQKGAMQKAWIRAPYQKWPKKMPGACPACTWHADAHPITQASRVFVGTHHL